MASPIGHEQVIASHVEAWARRHFGHNEVLRVGNSLVVGRRRDARDTVLLVGHLDTVPAQSDENRPRLEGDRLFGLGASDMKGALAVMMTLAEDVRLDELPVNVCFVMYEREEGPFQESGLGPLFAAAPELTTAELAIAMEPTDGRVQVGCVGSLHAQLLFKGQAAHSARPWQGKNAIHAAGELLTDLDSLGRREVSVDGFTFFEVMSATLARGGHARNVVPDSFELSLNYRFAPGKTTAQAETEVNEFVRQRCEVRVSDVAPSGRVCTGNSRVQRLIELTGLPAEAKQAWTDVARFSELGIDAVNFGPGETAQAHQRFESASLSALEQSFGALAGLLAQRPNTVQGNETPGLGR
jgi:succinyl-diaminopimelate desuccinylase